MDLLRRTCLRGFEADDPSARPWVPQARRRQFSVQEAPLPALLKAALNLIGVADYGPGEKVAWWLHFTVDGHAYELAHQKFGLRLYLRASIEEAEALELLEKTAMKLLAAVKPTERLILRFAPQVLGRGDVTVKNQDRSLLRAYQYFRGRCLNPEQILDTHEEQYVEFPSGGRAKAYSFTSGRAQTELNATHDFVAALTAYLSLLEHRLVLSLAFTDFDPERDNLTSIIGLNWGSKWRRLLGTQGPSAQYRQRLTEVVERWRNPYSHGGFEKGHGATLYLHTPGIGALPIAMSDVYSRARFSLAMASDTTRTEVFELFDEIDAWMRTALPEAVAWIESGLDIRFDDDFRRLVELARSGDDMEGLIRAFEYEQSVIDNMDY